MSKPAVDSTWGKAAKAVVRYELGRLIEEDERIESDVPEVFTHRDEVRATPRTAAKKRHKNRLPGPGKNVPVIDRDEASTLTYGDFRDVEDRDARRLAYAMLESDKKQRHIACQRRGHHDWRKYADNWYGIDVSGYVCADCGTRYH